MKLTIDAMNCVHNQYKQNLREHEQNRRRLDDALHFEHILRDEQLKLKSTE